MHLEHFWNPTPSHHRQQVQLGGAVSQARQTIESLVGMLRTLGVLDPDSDVELDEEQLAQVVYQIEQMREVAEKDYSALPGPAATKLRSVLGLDADAEAWDIVDALAELEREPAQHRAQYRQLRAVLRLSPLTSGAVVRCVTRYALTGAPWSNAKTITNAPRVAARKGKEVMNRPEIIAARTASPPKPANTNALPAVEVAPGLRAPSYPELLQLSEQQRTPVFHTLRVWLTVHHPLSGQLTHDELHGMTRLVLAAVMPSSQIAATARKVKADSAVLLAGLPGRNVVERAAIWLGMSPEHRGWTREQLLRVAAFRLQEANFRGRVLDTAEG